MRLNVQTDLALRLLMDLAARPDEMQSVEAIARKHSISRNHLAKVAQALVGKGHVVALRGRNGGLKLAKPADQIRVGEIVRDIENDLGVVECLQFTQHCTCAFLPGCRLKIALRESTQLFLQHLDGVTLASLVPDRKVAIPGRGMA